MTDPGTGGLIIYHGATTAGPFTYNALYSTAPDPGWTTGTLMLSIATRYWHYDNSYLAEQLTGANINKNSIEKAIRPLLKWDGVGGFKRK